MGSSSGAVVMIAGEEEEGCGAGTGSVGRMDEASSAQMAHWSGDRAQYLPLREWLSDLESEEGGWMPSNECVDEGRREVHEI